MKMDGQSYQKTKIQNIVHKLGGKMRGNNYNITITARILALKKDILL